MSNNIDMVMKKIAAFLDGDINAEDFSYDFPVTYSFYCHNLDKENPPFSRLMEEKVKVLCRAYDTFDYYNMPGETILSEADFRAAIAAAYDEEKTLI